MLTSAPSNSGQEGSHNSSVDLVVLVLTTLRRMRVRKEECDYEIVEGLS